MQQRARTAASKSHEVTLCASPQDGLAAVASPHGVVVLLEYWSIDQAASRAAPSVVSSCMRETNPHGASWLSPQRHFLWSQTVAAESALVCVPGLYLVDLHVAQQQ